MQPPPILTPHERRRIAVAAFVDPRSVERWLRGERMKSTVAARIAETVRLLKLDLKPGAVAA